MRYRLLFLIPYLVLLGIFVFSVSVLQRDQSQIKNVSLRQCDAERRMYATISAGLRRRAQIELDVSLPAVEGNIKATRAKALDDEAAEMDRVSSLLPNCPKP